MNFKQKQIRRKSIEKMYDINRQYAVEKMTDYYDTINQGVVSLPPMILAEREVSKAEREGRFNQYGVLNAI